MIEILCDFLIMVTSCITAVTALTEYTKQTF